MADVFNEAFPMSQAAQNQAAEADVRLATVYGDANQYTGELVVAPGVPNYPAETEVLDGITFGTTGSEEFTGNVVQALISDVRLAVQYGPNATDLTGNVTIPQEADVRLGTTYDTLLSRTGTLDPGVGDPDYPIADNVLDGIVYASGALTGNRVDAPEAQVLLGVLYGANGTSLTGQYDPNTPSPFGPAEWLGR